MQKLLLHILIFILLIFLWFILDKYCYLYKGISLVHKDNHLPYNTKVQIDHNNSCFYELVPKSINGYQLEPQLIFLHDTMWIPTDIYNKETFQIDTTIYVWELCRFGYNKSELVIEAIDFFGKSYYLEPLEINGQYYSSFVDSQMIDESNFRWIQPAGTIVATIAILWMILLIIIPIYPLYIFYLLCKYEDECNINLRV